MTRQASFWATVRAVLSGLLGVRKNSAYEEDARSLNPLAVVIAGLIAGAVFILVILAVVTLVLAE
ncbi:MAG TPA: DUF2970 domain-containing protein [Azoarcus sp.]|nr:DUF2970 domain-containing protein [Azoarcus sp.]